MRRELRRFIADRWTVLDVPADVAISLQHEWHRRFGYLPSGSAVRGFSFRVPKARAAYVLDIPAPDDVARTLTLLSAKFGSDMRQADGAALPTIPQPMRIAPELVEQYPVNEVDAEAPVVLEYLDSALLVSALRHRHSWPPPTSRLEDAMIFSSPTSAEVWRVANAPREPLVARYLAAVRAEHDIRDAADGYW